ncbi:hypothetical protein GCM10028824_12990 [Hymenobacter segetis]
MLPSLLLLLACLGNVRAQAPAWQSAVGANGAQVYAMAADASGNVYLAGAFNNSVTFGTITLFGSSLGDVFVAKWSNSAGRFVWAQQAGSIGNERATGIAVSGNSIYIVGDFSSPTLSFGTSSITNTTTTNTFPDIFIAKLTDVGNTGSFTWARQAGGARYDLAPAIAVSGSSVYIAGYYDSATISFGTTTLGNNTAPGVISTDIFVARLSDMGSTGEFDWANRAGGIGNEEAYGLATNGTDVYVVGYFASGRVNFGTTRLTNTREGSEDGYIAKLSDTGSFTWALPVGGMGSEIATAVAASGNNVFVTGFFSSSPASFGSTTLAAAGASDAFVANAVDAGPSAAFAWAQRAGGTGLDTPRGIAASGTDVYVTGYFDSPAASFGPTTLVNVAAPGTSSTDIFVCKLTGSGSFAWAAQAGSPARDEGLAVATSGTTVYVAGNASFPASFGTIGLSQVSGLAGFFATLGTSALAVAVAQARPDVVLYPNPASLGTEVLVAVPVGRGLATLTLLDACGRVVRQRASLPASVAPYTLALAGLSAGLYVLKVKTENGTQVCRLVIN